MKEKRTDEDYKLTRIYYMFKRFQRFGQYTRIDDFLFNSDPRMESVYAVGILEINYKIKEKLTKYDYFFDQVKKAMQSRGENWQIILEDLLS